MARDYDCDDDGDAREDEPNGKYNLRFDCATTSPADNGSCRTVVSSSTFTAFSRCVNPQTMYWMARMALEIAKAMETVVKLSPAAAKRKVSVSFCNRTCSKGNLSGGSYAIHALCAV